MTPERSSRWLADWPGPEHAAEPAARDRAGRMVPVEVHGQMRRVEHPTVLATNTTRCGRPEVRSHDSNHKASLPARVSRQPLHTVRAVAEPHRRVTRLQAPIPSESPGAKPDPGRSGFEQVNAERE